MSNNVYLRKYLLKSLCVIMFFIILLCLVNKVEYNKYKYLNNTLLKFEGKNIDDINKRIALLELYEKTSNAYDKGIRIDKEEFKRNREKLFKGQ